MKNTKIEIVGRGNVASHLFKAISHFADAQIVNPHSLESLRRDADIILIAVTDSAIVEVTRRIDNLCSNPSTIIAHTSGTTPLSAIDGSRHHTGVFYPLQTFSKQVELDYRQIPFFIEGDSEETAEKLSALASCISTRVQIADSTQRKSLHVAAVLVCNFVNHLWALSDQYLQANNLDFDMVRPLIAETFQKMMHHNPKDIQTGPASRRDYVTISSHLESLSSFPKIKEIYSLLSESIIQTCSKNIKI